jgi:hypothetical protein
MLRSLSPRLVLTLLLPALALPFAARAQSQDPQTPSIADAARRSKEQKKNAVKPVKVVTEDDIPARPADPGNAPTAAPQQTTSEAAAPGQPAAPASDKDAAAAKTADDADLAKLKSEVEQALREFELAQRGLSLDQDTFLANPDYIHDKAGKAKLDAERQQVADKQQLLDQLKAQLAARKPATPAKP